MRSLRKSLFQECFHPREEALLLSLASDRGYCFREEGINHFAESAVVQTYPTYIRKLHPQFNPLRNAGISSRCTWIAVPHLHTSEHQVPEQVVQLL